MAQKQEGQNERLKTSHRHISFWNDEWQEIIDAGCIE
jgi:hypothetical protein